MTVLAGALPQSLTPQPKRKETPPLTKLSLLPSSIWIGSFFDISSHLPPSSTHLMQSSSSSSSSSLPLRSPTNGPRQFSLGLDYRYRRSNRRSSLSPAGRKLNAISSARTALLERKSRLTSLKLQIVENLSTTLAAIIAHDEVENDSELNDMERKSLCAEFLLTNFSDSLHERFCYAPQTSYAKLLLEKQWPTILMQIKSFKECVTIKGSNDTLKANCDGILTSIEKHNSTEKEELEAQGAGEVGCMLHLEDKRLDLEKLRLEREEESAKRYVKAVEDMDVRRAKEMEQMDIRRAKEVEQMDIRRAKEVEQMDIRRAKEVEQMDIRRAKEMAQMLKTLLDKAEAAEIRRSEEAKKQRDHDLEVLKFVAVTLSGKIREASAMDVSTMQAAHPNHVPPSLASLIHANAAVVSKATPSAHLPTTSPPLTNNRSKRSRHS